MPHRLLPTLVICALAGSACLGRNDASPRLASRAGADIALPIATRLVSARVAVGATFASLLRAHHVAEPEIATVVSGVASAFDLRRFRAGQPYRLQQTLVGALRLLEYEIDGDRLLRVSRPGEDAAQPLVTEVVPIEKTGTVATVRGTISRDVPSLIGALDVSGETIGLSLALADIFSGEIDFNTDLQPGDHVELLVEKLYRDDHAFAGYGPVNAAIFENAGRHYRVVRFTPDGGAPGYYDERGVSMRKFFLRSPLPFNPVVSSRFSRSRLHPILREYRAHLGVDFKAPAGTPVVAVANGTVLRAGMSGAAGRMVHLDHANGFESEYLHLSSIAVRPGAHVRQGDVIGRVGSSGLATGAHLDYRLKKNGQFINPLAPGAAQPPAEPIPADQMAAFAEVRDRALGELTLSDGGVARAGTSASSVVHVVDNR